jgi:hypothetical protein
MAIMKIVTFSEDETGKQIDDTRFEAVAACDIVKRASLYKSMGFGVYPSTVNEARANGVNITDIPVEQQLSKLTQPTQPTQPGQPVSHMPDTDGYYLETSYTPPMTGSPSYVKRSAPEPVIFEDNGVLYKSEDGIVYKKEWVEICDEDYTVFNNDGTVSDSDVHIRKLTWVSLIKKTSEPVEPVKARGDIPGHVIIDEPVYIDTSVDDINYIDSIEDELNELDYESTELMLADDTTDYSQTNEVGQETIDEE